MLRTPTLRARVVRGFNISKVAAEVAPADFILAKQEAPQLYSFFAFPGADAAATSKKLLETFSESDRVVHSVFGRNGSLMDFVADLDSPLYEDAVALGLVEPTTPRFTGESLLLRAVEALREYLASTLQITTQPELLVLDGGAKDKISYHIHMRIPGRVFTDFNAVRDVANAMNNSLPGRPVDLSVYRPNGMLRMAYTPKFTERERILRPLKAEDDALASLLVKPSELSPEEVMARSLILRPDATELKAIEAGGAHKRLVHDEHGNVVPVYLAEDKKWLRFSEATAAVRRLPDEFADDYATWVRIGLALHSFGAEPQILGHWVTFSARCRSKFDVTSCEKKWDIFGRRPDCFNWRRGYTYLTRVLVEERKNRHLKRRE